MSKKTKDRKTVPRGSDTFMSRLKRAYRLGYTRGFEDSARLNDVGSSFVAKYGYGEGVRAKKKIQAAQRKYNKYKGQ